MLKEGAVAGLSFGYRVRKSSGAAPRALEDIELVEISLVSLPMQLSQSFRSSASKSSPNVSP